MSIEKRWFLAIALACIWFLTIRGLIWLTGIDLSFPVIFAHLIYYALKNGIDISELTLGIIEMRE